MIPPRLKRFYHRRRLNDPEFAFLFEPGPEDELVCFDCETTGLNPSRDDIISIGAVKIRGDRILASERFQRIVRPKAAMSADAIKVHRLRAADVAYGEGVETVIPDFLRFVGGRPLVGYYLQFDVAMVNKYLKPMKHIKLPNPMIEVSEQYYERKYGDAPAGSHIDLSFAAILKDLGIPPLDAHDAFNDAMMTAMMYLALRDLKARGVRIARQTHVSPGYGG
ncbi:MAG: 3'-5' exonuclease [Hyphomicrobiales bacterium]|nr:3'-5' exonuclease [Hyphomicrobiales bacterium]